VSKLRNSGMTIITGIKAENFEDFIDPLRNGARSEINVGFSSFRDFTTARGAIR
jgi:hypothetical protein